MYSVSVSRAFVAQHYLTVPDPGPEGELHSHRYEAVVELRGDSLNEYGYLADIDDVNDALDAVVDAYRDETLNDRPEFEGLNPSVEHFARIVHGDLDRRLDAASVSSMRVEMWEDDDAWAAYESDV
jgi:6-pyruvoyltetrahydropterin/6-carboxytetrahydropterin synthase